MDRLVLHGDAFDLFPLLPANSIDLMITSPPYWGHREYGLNHSWELFNDISAAREFGAVTPGYDWYRSQGGTLGLEPYPEWYVGHLAEIFLRAMPALKSEGNLWVNVGDTYFARWSSIRNGGRQGLGDEQRFRRKTPMGGFRQEKQLLLIPSRFAIAMQDNGWILRNDVIWYKPNGTPRPEGDRLKLSHEHFFHFVRKPKEGRPAYFYRPEYAESRNNDVITVNVTQGEDGHTATFPHALIEPRILTSSPSNGRVLDPFCGTGRALEVAARLGRKVVGFDAQLDYVRITRGKFVESEKAMPESVKQGPSKGNYVSEWFGQRIFPTVHLEVASVTGKRSNQCPFLSSVQKRPCECVKNENSKGVCTISSSSNGTRQDWLACPYRVIDSAIVKSACAKIFGLDEEVQPQPVSLLEFDGELAKFKAHVKKEGRGYLFFQDKLGGEISILATPKSPEMAFDVTLIEITYAKGTFSVSRYGILELQTMDFHGSYKHAVSNLRDALRLHDKDFPEALQSKPEWSGKGVEGPNIANVFKRTFYQIMLKFKLSGHGCAAGTVLALPRAVWDSWQPFLGAPELEEEAPGLMRFKVGAAKEEQALNAYICIFDLDAAQNKPISPVQIDAYIRVSPERLAHHAFTQVPENMLLSIKDNDAILSRIRYRLLPFWPDFKESGAVDASGKKRVKSK
jgi:site-specific DNA-methyltransferase (adenine-specific)